MYLIKSLSRLYTTKTPLEIIKAFKSDFTAAKINKQDLTIKYSRSSGPGGQNVNKVNSKVEIRFEIGKVDWIPHAVKEILLKELPGIGITKGNEYLVASDRFRYAGL